MTERAPSPPSTDPDDTARDFQQRLMAGMRELAMLAVDRHLTIVHCSEAAARIYRLPAARIIGADAAEILPAELVERLRQAHAGTGQEEGSLVLPLTQDDSLRPTVVARLLPLQTPTGPLQLLLLLPARQVRREVLLYQLGLTMDHSNSAFLLIDEHLRIAYANPGFERMFGYTCEELQGRIASEVLSGDNTDPDTLRTVQDHAANRQSLDIDALVYRKDHQPFWASITTTQVAIGNTPGLRLSVFIDITPSKMHEVLHQHVLEAIVREQPIGEVLTMICQEMERITRGLMASVLAVDEQSRLWPMAAPSLPADMVATINGLQIGPGAGACGSAAWHGHTVTVSDTRTDPLFTGFRQIAREYGLMAVWSTPIKSSGGRVIGTFAFYYREPREPDAWHIQLAEICQRLCAIALEREQTRARVHRLAFYDALTTLPNRSMFTARAEQMIAGGEGQSLAVMFLDLDRFKRVNETQGHVAGDNLLHDIAERLSASLDARGLIGRQVGDEFVIALPHCTAEYAGGIAERLLGVIATPAVVGRMTLHPSASIGVAMFPEDGRDIDTLLRHADLAMHRAKTEGGGSFRFFSADMNRLAQERVALETALREAIRRDQLKLHYQPQVHSAAPHLLHGVEVLLRWTHPQLGPISPSRFIPLAEESGMIGELGRWVLRNAFAQLAEWRARGIPVPRISINLSVRNFEDPQLLEVLQNKLRRYGLAPGDFTLEMTESVMLSPMSGVLENIQAMRDAGFTLSLDDFGTGYSSLSHLHRLPIGELKLDMSFVRDLEHSAAARALTDSVLRIGDSLGKTVVAEGVETEHQRDLLASLGCAVLQGFLFSRPLHAEALEQWIRDRAA